MPYRTKSGSHYHETYGCHGATIACSTEGLEPCSDCCGGAAAGGDAAGGVSGTEGTGGGTPAVPDPAGDGCFAADDGGIASDANAPASQAAHAAPPAEVLEVGVASVAEGGQDAPEGPIEAKTVADDVARAEQGVRRQFGYRSELLFGEGYTEAAPVLAHETFVLGNTDILRHLGDGVLAGTDIGGKLMHIAAVMDGEEADEDVSAFVDRCYRDQDGCAEGRALFGGEVLPAIREATGHSITHVMWLCDCPEDVMEAYGHIDEIYEEDIDEHEVGVMTLSDIGEDGKLWGYEHPIAKPDRGWW